VKDHLFKLTKVVHGPGDADGVDRGHDQQQDGHGQQDGSKAHDDLHLTDGAAVLSLDDLVVLPVPYADVPPCLQVSVAEAWACMLFPPFVLLIMARGRRERRICDSISVPCQLSALGAAVPPRAYQELACGWSGIPPESHGNYARLGARPRPPLPCSEVKPHTLKGHNGLSPCCGPKKYSTERSENWPEPAGKEG